MFLVVCALLPFLICTGCRKWHSLYLLCRVFISASNGTNTIAVHLMNSHHFFFRPQRPLSPAAARCLAPLRSPRTSNDWQLCLLYKYLAIKSCNPQPTDYCRKSFNVFLFPCLLECSLLIIFFYILMVFIKNLSSNLIWLILPCKLKLNCHELRRVTIMTLTRY